MFFRYQNSTCHRPDVRTQPSVITQLQQPTNATARQTYQERVLQGPTVVTQQTTSVPRDMEQVRNCMKAARKRLRLTRDALYNLHELAPSSGQPCKRSIITAGKLFQRQQQWQLC